MACYFRKKSPQKDSQIVQIVVATDRLGFCDDERNSSVLFSGGGK